MSQHRVPAAQPQPPLTTNTDRKESEMAASYFQRKRLRELHSELRTVQDRIQRINTPGRREIRRLEKAGHYHDSCVVHDELVSTLSPLWKEQVRLEREINEAERWV